jgi:hypothetical protein
MTTAIQRKYNNYNKSTPKTQTIKDVKQKEKLNMPFNNPTVTDA